MDDGYCPSPMIAAAAIVGRTKRIRIGQGVVLRSMELLAKEVIPRV